MNDNFVAGIWADAAFLRKVGRSEFRAAVHSVFDRAINISVEADDEIFTLVVANLDIAPNTLMVDVPRFATFGVDVGDRLIFTPGVFSISNKFAVDLGEVRIWQPPAYIRLCDNAALRARLEEARAFLDAHGTRGGLFGDPSSTDVARLVSAKLADAGGRLVAALANDEFSAARAAAGELIGLGPGLTPSGDDFLAGLLASLSASLDTGRAAHSVVADLRDEVVALARTATNAISYTMIKKAAQGAVRASIARLIAELLGADAKSLHAVIADVVAIGFSSGTDMAFGVLCGLEAALAMEARRS